MDGRRFLKRVFSVEDDPVFLARWTKVRARGLAPFSARRVAWVIVPLALLRFLIQWLRGLAFEEGLLSLNVLLNVGALVALLIYLAYATWKRNEARYNLLTTAETFD